LYGYYAGFSNALSLSLVLIQIDVAFTVNHHPDVTAFETHVDGTSESGPASRFSKGGGISCRDPLFALHIILNDFLLIE
jgi:hypothetical protein